jgi:glycine cleavage system H lipoate-binding protein
MIGVSLPSLQASVPARVPSAWCRFDQGMVPVRLPFALQATGVNPVVGHDPSSVLDDPYESGWLFDARIDRSRLDGAGVMSAWTAEKMYAEDEQQFVEAIRDAGGRSPKPAGRTGYDGGTVSQEALQLLGSAQYCSLIARMYCKAS